MRRSNLDASSLLSTYDKPIFSALIQTSHDIGSFSFCIWILETQIFLVCLFILYIQIYYYSLQMIHFIFIVCFYWLINLHAQKQSIIFFIYIF